MKAYLSLLIITLSFAAHAQQLNITVFGGVANYQGDLQDKRYTLKQGHAAVGAGILYDLTDHFSLRANATYGKISADDKYGINKLRNLSFTSNILDATVGVDYNLFVLTPRSVTPYVFAGLTYFHFNPYAVDSGKKYFLQPLGTEGQGFYDGRTKYNLNQFALAFGGGLKFYVNDYVNFGLEVGLRKTATDYLDDVSQTYADQTSLALNNGQKAADLAYRGDELKNGSGYPAAGSQRGSPKNKDWYYFSGATLSYLLHRNEGGGKSSRGLGCPTRL